MRRVVVAFDPDSPVQAQAACAVERSPPPDYSVAVRPVGTHDALCVPALDEELIVLLATDRTAAMRSIVDRSGRSARLVAVLLDIWPSGIASFHACYRDADLVLVSDLDLWRGLGCLPRTRWVPFGADDRIFFTVRPPTERARSLVWLAPPRSHRARVYEPWMIDPEGFVSAIGFRSESVSPDATPQERAELFNRAAVAVCTSPEAEPLRRLLEAAACGCAVVVTTGANPGSVVQDGVNGALAQPGVDSMTDAIQRAFEQRSAYAQRMSELTRESNWTSFARRVFETLATPSSDLAKDRSPVDLSDEVTVFVTNVGAPSFDSCLNHLEQQDCTFRREIIENVAPMSAAFQRMLDACRTPYYVQVDEDMLLYPEAVRLLHAQISAAPAEVALVVAFLHDVHLGQPVQGVKIFRHAVANRYPLANVRSCEIDQIDRMRADGYTYQVMPIGDGENPPFGRDFAFRILGLHGTHHSPRSVFERFRTLELARHKHPAKLKHQEAWPAMLLERFLERGDPFDFLALMGLLSGARASQDLVGQEKDFRTYSSLPGFDAACRFLGKSAFDAREASLSGRGGDASPGRFCSDTPD